VPSAPRTRPISAPASAPPTLGPTATARMAGSARPERGRSHASADRPSSEPLRSGAAKAAPAAGALPAQAQHGRRVAKGHATAQAKPKAGARGRRSEPKGVKSHRAHPVHGTQPASAVKAHPAKPAHPERPAVAGGPPTHAQLAGTQSPPPAAADPGPAGTTPPGNSGVAHATK
jgi:hypothetical protein